jgi:short subunit fatty acids transporter
MLSVSLDCPFLIAPSVFSNVYLILVLVFCMVLCLVFYVRDNRRGNQEWVNPEKLATMSTQDTGRRHTKKNKNKTIKKKHKNTEHSTT